jgi:hypothetical protein
MHDDGMRGHLAVARSRTRVHDSSWHRFAGRGWFCAAPGKQGLRYCARDSGRHVLNQFVFANLSRRADFNRPVFFVLAVFRRAKNAQTENLFLWSSSAKHSSASRMDGIARLPDGMPWRKPSPKKSAQ